MRRFQGSKAWRKWMQARYVPLLGPGSETDKTSPPQREDKRKNEKSNGLVSSRGERKRKTDRTRKGKSSVALFEDCPVEENLER